MITSLGFKVKVRPQKLKKERHAIGNVLKKDISKSIREFEKFEKLPSEKKRPKHESTDSYFYQERQLVKCMMRFNNLNWYDHGGYIEMTALSLNVNAMDEDESKRIIAHEGLLESCSTNKSKSKRSIVNETLLQKFPLTYQSTLLRNNKTNSIRNLELLRK